MKNQSHRVNPLILIMGLLIVFICNCKKDDSPLTFNIYPGVAIGDFELGDNLQTLKSHITETSGNHASFFTSASGSYWHLLKYNQTGIGFFLETNSSTLYNTDIPHAIYAFSPFVGNTEKGITIGSLLTEVAKQYGIPNQITEDGSYYYTNSLGIAFWADDSKTKVDEIYVTKPGSSKNGEFIIFRQLKFATD